MNDLLINLLASLIFAFFAFSAGWSLRRLRDWYSLAHITRFVGKHDCIKIVVPGSRVPTFTIVHDGKPHEARVPANVLSMGMSEGQAIGELINVIHRASPKTRIIIVPAPHFDDDGIPFFCVGGPSINVATRRYVTKFFQPFSIKYPDHIAGWSENYTYNPSMEDGELTEDFGFVFFGKEGSTMFMLFFGVWTFGTLIAVRSFLSTKRKSEIFSAIFKSRAMAATYHADVSKYFVGLPSLLNVRWMPS